MKAEVIERIKKHILHMVEMEKIPVFHLSWFGGEPLLYFKEVVYSISLYTKHLCKENGISFYNSITTNASKITPEMVDQMNEISLSIFQITIDGDKERHDKIRNEEGNPSFDHEQYIIIVSEYSRS